MSIQAAVADARSISRNLEGKYLTFKLGEESYGIPVLKVREIIQLTPITKVPQLPHHIKGVINLRGKVIPVADLRLRFALENPQDTEFTCIIVVQIARQNGNDAWMGLIVDAVEEVANIRESEIEEKPHFGVSLDSDYILAMAKFKDSVKTLIDIDKVISAETLNQVTEKIVG